MALSAAELQKRHGLEGAPDPFPTLGNGPTSAPASSSASKKVNNGPPAPVDTASEDAFPSLGPAAPATTVSKPAISTWSAKPAAVSKAKTKPAPSGGMGRTGGPTTGSHPFSDSFSIPAADVDPKALAETLKKVSEQTGVVVESSTQLKTGLKTFYIKAADQKRLTYARKLIERGLSKNVTIQVEVPISTLGTIIGPKGATLKTITESTQCKIDIPRRDTLPSYEPNPDASEDEDEPLVSISVAGPSVACNDAKARILALIAGKVSQTSMSIKTIPSPYYPFISKSIKSKNLDDVKVHVPPPAVWKALERQGEDEVQDKERDLAIKVRGEKTRVQTVVADILRQYEELNDTLRELKISIPKRQHRFLVGSAADEILGQTGCIVDLPPVEDPSDQCVIRGPQPSLIPALTLVMDKANAISVEMVDVAALHRPNTSDPTHAKRVLRYLQRTSKLRSIADANGVKVYPPFPSTLASGSVVIEVVGEDKKAVAKAKDELYSAIRAILPAGITELQVDYMVHSLLIGKKGAKIAQFESTNNVTTLFPPASEESSEVLVLYTGSENLPSDKKARDAKLKELLVGPKSALEELARGAADTKTETLDVDKKFHRAIVGPGGTVLNALIGEDGLVNVKVGSKDSDDDAVIVRGPSAEVDRVVAEIKQIVEDAKNDDLVNGYTVEFSVDKKYVPHLVGSSGSSINKLRETLGVRVNFDDEAKSKKPMAHCKIMGRKEAVEEAKKRLEAQIEKLADETTEFVTIKRAIQPALIGSGGKYAIRLEERHGVKLSFPRDKEGAKPDEVTIRGGKKGVAAARAELLEAAAFETESRQEAAFTVPTKSVAQIVGKAGATINQIKDESGAQIDIDKSSEGGKTTVTVRGDKKAIAAAKAAVLAVAEQIGDEVTVSLTIDPKYHRTLIGQGGQKLRDLISSAGGPTEPFKQSGLVTFPRQGDESTDQVRLRGDKKVVKSIQIELERQVAVLKDTIIVGVAVPTSQHASKIGRGGNALQDLQRKTGTTVHFPGSRQYGTVGEIANADELKGTDEKDIVKVIGSKEACAKAAELLAIVTERRQEPRAGRSTSDLPTRSVSIPSKYYHAIADQQNLLRQIRSAGGNLNLPQSAPPRPVASRTKPNGDSLAAKAARIDLDGEANGDDQPIEAEWELRENYGGADEGELEWVIRAKEEDLDKVAVILEGALEKAKAATHVGFLTGLPRSAFPRIIGSKGATISRMRSDTGADIQVGKDDDLIIITGDESSVLQAKDAITSIASRSGGPRF